MTHLTMRHHYRYIVGVTLPPDHWAFQKFDRMSQGIFG